MVYLFSDRCLLIVQAIVKSLLRISKTCRYLVHQHLLLNEISRKIKLTHVHLSLLKSCLSRFSFSSRNSAIILHPRRIDTTNAGIEREILSSSWPPKSPSSFFNELRESESVSIEDIALHLNDSGGGP